MSAQIKHIIRTGTEQLVPAVSALSSCFALSFITDPVRAVPPCLTQGAPHSGAMLNTGLHSAHKPHYCRYSTKV